MCGTEAIMLNTARNAQKRIARGAGTIFLGIYACSPEISSFEAVFAEIERRSISGWLVMDRLQIMILEDKIADGTVS